MSGIDATLFFTFWGLDVITAKKVDHLHVATVGNPSAPQNSPGRAFGPGFAFAGAYGTGEETAVRCGGARSENPGG